jgi:hypothetical protein
MQEVSELKGRIVLATHQEKWVALHHFAENHQVTVALLVIRR